MVIDGYIKSIKIEEETNKYQKALDKIVSTICPQHIACNSDPPQYVCNCDMKIYIDTLQELINENNNSR